MCRAVGLCPPSEYMLSTVTGSKSPSGIDERFESEKEAAARAAIGYVRSGMVLGLGSGSTAGYFVPMVAERIRSGELMIEAVPSSVVVAMRARRAAFSLRASTGIAGRFDR